MFDLLDEEGKGGISFQNLKNVVQEVEDRYTDTELQQMIDKVDRDGDGLISREDFYRVMKKTSANPLDEFSSDEDDT